MNNLEQIYNRRLSLQGKFEIFLFRNKNNQVTDLVTIYHHLWLLVFYLIASYKVTDHNWNWTFGEKWPNLQGLANLQTFIKSNCFFICWRTENGFIGQIEHFIYQMCIKNWINFERVSIFHSFIVHVNRPFSIEFTVLFLSVCAELPKLVRLLYDTSPRISICKDLQDILKWKALQLCKLLLSLLSRN